MSKYKWTMVAVCLGLVGEWVMYSFVSKDLAVAIVIAAAVMLFGFCVINAVLREWL